MRRSVRRLVLGGGARIPASIPRKALAPATDIAVATVELGANRVPGEPVGEEKNQPRVTRSGVAPFQWTVDGSEN